MIEFRVEGMTCGGCARGVTNAITRVDAGAVVNVDLPSKTVFVNSTSDARHVKEAIEAAGFEVSL